MPRASAWADSRQSPGATTDMDIATLSATAKALVAPGKGILAADESGGTIKKRFDSISVESTEENRRDYREMLFTAKGVGRLHQRRHPLRRDHPPGRGRRHAAGEAAREPGHHPRHQGRPRREAARAVADGETVTEGLDGLRERLAEYHSLGARFAKWRATYTITATRHARRSVLHRRERARARALRRALPGGGHRADRRARGPDGRRRTRSSARST